MKKCIALVTLIALVISMTACGGSQTPDTPGTAESQAASTDQPAQEAAPETAGEKEHMTFWYLWGGDEGAIIEEIISSFNSSQDQYELEGLSVPDEQKIIVAISGGAGPDVTDNFGNNVIKYGSGGIAECLDEYVSRENFDLSIYVDNALNMQKHDGKLYALPLSVNVYALYYNTDLLSAAGQTEPPKTLEALKAMILENTKAEGGSISTLGGMYIPDTYWPFAWVNASGYNFGAPDGSSITPDNAGMRDALAFTKELVDIAGSDAMSNFITSGVSNWGNPQDPFIAGQQMFRVDGPWYYNIAKATNPDLNFAIAAFPGSEATGGTGYSLLETSNMFIPSTSAHKDGAWEFLKFITCGEGSKIFVSKKGDLAPTKAMLTDANTLSSFEHFPVYFDIINQGKAVSSPMFERTSDYHNAIKAAIEAVVLGADVESAMQEYLDTVNQF